MISPHFAFPFQISLYVSSTPCLEGAKCRTNTSAGRKPLRAFFASMPSMASFTKTVSHLLCFDTRYRCSRSTLLHSCCLLSNGLCFLPLLLSSAVGSVRPRPLVICPRCLRQKSAIGATHQTFREGKRRAEARHRRVSRTGRGNASIGAVAR